MQEPLWEQVRERGQEQGLTLEQGLGVEGTERTHLQVPLKVLEVVHCTEEGPAGAEVGAQTWGSLAGIQLGGSKGAEEAVHSLPVAVQSLREEEDQNTSSLVVEVTFTHFYKKLLVLETTLVCDE